jgi:transposase
VISAPASTQVHVHRDPVDLRKHFDGLWGIVTQQLRVDPYQRALFVFIAKSRRRAKVLWWDGTGLIVLCKRLDTGRFIAPWDHSGQGPLLLTHSELMLLLEGCEHVGRLPLSPPPWSPTTAP